MLPEIWEPEMKVVFVGTVVLEPSDSIGFHHLHPRDRFWELLALGGITPQRIITAQERRALSEGHARGNVSDPVRSMFLQKKTSQLLKLRIGITQLNRRVVVANEKDKSARPSPDDIQQFVTRVEELNPGILAFTTDADLFVGSFKTRYPGVSDTLGAQSFKIGTSDVWLLGSTTKMLRGEALTKQEDLFFELGETISALRREAGEH
jgi:G:T/U-mismatch repair DNA glycosylase